MLQSKQRNNWPGSQKTGFLLLQTKLFVKFCTSVFRFELLFIRPTIEEMFPYFLIGRAIIAQGYFSDASANHKIPNPLLCKIRDLRNHLSRQSLKNRYLKGTCVRHLICINGHESMTVVRDTTGIPHKNNFYLPGFLCNVSTMWTWWPFFCRTCVAHCL